MHRPQPGGSELGEEGARQLAGDTVTEGLVGLCRDSGIFILHETRWGGRVKFHLVFNHF